MNAKRAKLLRKIAEYRNASATPYTREFPGLAKNLLRVPVAETRLVERKEWDSKRREYVTKTVLRLVHDNRERVVMKPYERKIIDGKEVMVPREDLVARSAPLRLKETTARGRYRLVKAGVRRHGFASIIQSLHQAAQGAQL